MAQASTLYRFQINFSDVDQGVYKTLDLRTAQHPSESVAYLLTRILAFVLNEREFLKFADEGLGDPDQPAISAQTPGGDILLWIEIGNPGARKLHKASKAARQVKVYTYKDPKPLLEDICENKVHHAEQIEVWSFNSKFLENLANRLERKNSWDILLNDGSLNVSIGEHTEMTELIKHPISAAN